MVQAGQVHAAAAGEFFQPPFAAVALVGIHAALGLLDDQVGVQAGNLGVSGVLGEAVTLLRLFRHDFDEQTGIGGVGVLGARAGFRHA